MAARLSRELCVRFPAELEAELRACAEREERPLSQVVRLAVRRYFDARHDREKDGTAGGES